MNGYKIVRNVGYLESPIVGIRNLIDARIYIPGEWIRNHSGSGPLTVFDTLRHAHGLCWDNPPLEPWEIWECDYLPSLYDTLWTEDMSFTKRRKFCPDGTRFASHVKLTRMVEHVW